MTISTLIRELQKLQAEHGDLPVIVTDAAEDREAPCGYDEVTQIDVDVFRFYSAISQESKSVAIHLS